MDPHLIITGIVGFIGIVSTIIAWYFNPSRRNRAELDSIEKQIKELNEKDAKALFVGDGDVVSSIQSELIQLYDRRKSLLERVGQSDSGKG